MIKNNLERDLLKQMLEKNPTNRITADEALLHNYLTTELEIIEIEEEE